VVLPWNRDDWRRSGGTLGWLIGYFSKIES